MPDPYILAMGAATCGASLLSAYCLTRWRQAELSALAHYQRAQAAVEAALDEARLTVAQELAEARDLASRWEGAAKSYAELLRRSRTPALTQVAPAYHAPWAARPYQTGNRQGKP